MNNSKILTGLALAAAIIQTFLPAKSVAQEEQASVARGQRINADVTEIARAILVLERAGIAAQNESGDLVVQGTLVERLEALGVLENEYAVAGGWTRDTPK